MSWRQIIHTSDALERWTDRVPFLVRRRCQGLCYDQMSVDRYSLNFGMSDFSGSRKASFLRLRNGIGRLRYRLADPRKLISRLRFYAFL